MNATRKPQSSDTPEPSHPAAGSGIGNETADAGSMDKIRDILFGNQARDYEKRFARMEIQVAQDAAELKSEMIKRIDALEMYVKQEIKDINDRIKKESNHRDDADKSIQLELKTSVEKINKKLLAEEENLAKKSTELREQILEQSKALSDDIRTKSELAAENLKTAAEELDDAKVNRSDLSGFFLEIAMRLSGDDPGNPST